MRPPIPRREDYATAEEAEAAEHAYYAALTPEQRMEILFEILAKARNYDEEAAQGFPRVVSWGKLRHDEAGNEIEESLN